MATTKDKRERARETKDDSPPSGWPAAWCERAPASPSSAEWEAACAAWAKRAGLPPDEPAGGVEWARTNLRRLIDLERTATRMRSEAIRRGRFSELSDAAHPWRDVMREAAMQRHVLADAAAELAEELDDQDRAPIRLLGQCLSEFPYVGDGSVADVLPPTSTRASPPCGTGWLLRPMPPRVRPSRTRLAASGRSRAWR